MPLENSAPSPEPRAIAAKECVVCKNKFKPYRWWQVYCGKDCRKKGYWLTHEVVIKPRLDGQVL